MCWEASGAEEAAEEGGEALGSVILGSGHERERERESVLKTKQTMNSGGMSYWWYKWVREREREGKRLVMYFSFSKF